jgi:hypothetical protein
MILWNSGETSPDLIEESSIINNYLYSENNYVLNLSGMGALDSARASSYDETNWADLTVEELENEIDSFNSLMSVNYSADDGLSVLIIENRQDDSSGQPYGILNIPDDVELHGYGGVFNTIEADGTYTKYWTRDDKTTNASGEFSLTGYESGTKVICRNKSDGDIEVLDAADTVTTSWESTDIEILYQLDEPTTEDINITNTLGDLYKTDNYLVPYIKQTASFTGDGYTTEFSTTFAPDKVYVNGLDVTDDTTLGDTSVTFSTAPRRKAIIDVYGASLTGADVAIQMDVLKPSETIDSVPALTDVSLTENEEDVGYVNINGSTLKEVGNKTYSVTLSKDLIEGQDNILEGYRDKKFRLKVYNPRDEVTEYLGVCHIEPDASKNYLDGTESITIKCGDLYD